MNNKEFHSKRFTAIKTTIDEIINLGELSEKVEMDLEDAGKSNPTFNEAKVLLCEFKDTYFLGKINNPITPAEIVDKGNEFSIRFNFGKDHNLFSEITIRSDNPEFPILNTTDQRFIFSEEESFARRMADLILRSHKFDKELMAIAQLQTVRA
jgi:hypothetical protein